jgi:hypothetical protein
MPVETGGFSLAVPLSGAYRDFMRVVLPEGGTTTLNFTYVDGVEREASILIGIPEPGTIMLLLTGMLCLVGVRRR